MVEALRFLSDWLCVLQSGVRYSTLQSELFLDDFVIVVCVEDDFPLSKCP